MIPHIIAKAGKRTQYEGKATVDSVFVTDTGSAILLRTLRAALGRSSTLAARPIQVRMLSERASEASHRMRLKVL
jgi:hypothetical protein